MKAGSPVDVLVEAGPEVHQDLLQKQCKMLACMEQLIHGNVCSATAVLLPAQEHSQLSWVCLYELQSNLAVIGLSLFRINLLHTWHLHNCPFIDSQMWFLKFLEWKSFLLSEAREFGNQSDLKQKFKGLNNTACDTLLTGAQPL